MVVTSVFRPKFRLVLLMVGILGSPSLGLARTTILAARAQFTTFSHLLEDYKASVGSYPSTRDGLEALVKKPAGVDPALWKGPYLARLPTDPWKNQYIYRCPGRHNPTKFDLYSLGRDKKSRSDGHDKDDINNWDPESGAFYRQVKWKHYFLIACSVALLIALGYVCIARRRKSELSCPG